MKRAEILRARGAIRRLRNALAEARPALAVLEELAELPDHIGRYRLARGEELDETDVLAFLRLAREQSPGAVEIIVLNRSEELQVTDRQVPHERSSHERPAGAAGGHRNSDAA